MRSDVQPPFLGETLDDGRALLAASRWALSRKPITIMSETSEAAGIPELLVRYSVGIENARDLIPDLRNGLERVERSLELETPE